MIVLSGSSDGAWDGGREQGNREEGPHGGEHLSRPPCKMPRQTGKQLRYCMKPSVIKKNVSTFLQIKFLLTPLASEE